MEFKSNGAVVQVNPAEQSDTWLLDAAREIADAARERGLVLAFVTGAAAVGGAMREQETGPSIESPVPPTKESLAERLTPASEGYRAVIETLNATRHGGDVLTTIATDEAIAAEFEAWFTEDKLAYVAAAQEADPGVRFTLVATPNVLATDKELVKLAKAFGESQPYETYIWSPLYPRYTPEQLSGTDPGNGNSVVFSLIPSTYTPGMEGTIVGQRTKLAELQATTPGLKVPRPLEAITYWQTLRAQGEQLTGSGTFDRTHIRHFDLPEQDIEDWRGVPGSCVSDLGEPSLDSSGGRRGRHSRVAVG